MRSDVAVMYRMQNVCDERLLLSFTFTLQGWPNNCFQKSSYPNTLKGQAERRTLMMCSVRTFMKNEPMMSNTSTEETSSVVLKRNQFSEVRLSQQLYNSSPIHSKHTGLG